MTAEAIAAGALSLAGVWLGASLGNRQDRARWRREWAGTRIQEIRSYAADVCEAVDRQMVVLGQAIDAAQRNRDPIPPQRVVDADTQWAAVLTRRYIYALDDLQHAMTGFDHARAAVATTANAQDAAGVQASYTALESTRLDVLNAIQSSLNAANETLAEHLSPGWRRLKHSLRRQPLAPVGEFVSRSGRGADPLGEEALPSG
jgi:hypothetical protein